jgi:hypothetical protein
VKKIQLQIIGQGDLLERGAEYELTGVEHEGLVPLRFDQRGQLVLLHRCGSEGSMWVYLVLTKTGKSRSSRTSMEHLLVERVDAPGAQH